MYQMKIPTVLLTLSLTACTTPQTLLVPPELSSDITAPCLPLPQLVVPANEMADMRVAILKNRIESVLIHNECVAKHAAALSAIGAVK